VEKGKVNVKTGTLCSVMLFTVIMTIVVVGPDYVWATASVSVSPSSVVADTGQNFSINVTVSSVIDLYGWEFSLNWSAAYLDVVNITEGPFLRNGGETFFTSLSNNTEGHLITDCTLLGNVPGVSGSGVLAVVTFYVKAAGESLLDLYYASLLDSSYPEPQTIPCQTAGGYWSSSVQHDVSIADIAVSPTTLLPGQIVAINTTVQNGGVYTETFNVTTYAGLMSVGEQEVTLESGHSTVLQFTWDTSGWGKGEYGISSSASIVPGEVDTENNSKTASDKVTILTPTHDVAVTNVTASKTVVGQGFCMFINVTVKNFGIYGETFNTITYANDTAVNTTFVTLASGNEMLLPLVWNTSGFLMGAYTVKSYAEPVSGETDVSDNILIFGQVAVAKIGDINSRVPNTPDGKVDMFDIAAVARPFGMQPGGSLWNGNADITGTTLGLPDNKIDMRDIALVAKSFGK
jgi:hypothetical protein